ncbi:MAG TPA: hypothetical protein VNE71_00935, partial [Myxococcota bacterium]|nr:hypothetical protein [Myxococcota bacterium]
VFDAAVLEGLVRATERLAALPEAGAVLSLANAPDVRAASAGACSATRSTGARSWRRTAARPPSS